MIKNITSLRLNKTHIYISIYENTLKKLEGFYLIFDKQQSTHWCGGLETKINLQICELIEHCDNNVRWFNKLSNKNKFE